MEQQEKTEQALSAKESKAMKKEEKRKLKETKREQKAGKIGKKRKKAPIIIAAIIIILIVIRMVSCAFSGSAGVMVSTTNAFRGDIEENVSTSGKVASDLNGAATAFTSPLFKDDSGGPVTHSSQLQRQRSIKKREPKLPFCST